MSVIAERTTECAACGISFTWKGYGKSGEFHSPECYRAGRSDCKYCHEPLEQPANGAKREFCPRPKPCASRYYRARGDISALLIEEYERTTCIFCDGPIEQPKTGGRRIFCEKRVCKTRYYRSQKSNQNFLEKWGGYLPETRKLLLYVENHLGLGTAKQLALAISREYAPRKQGNPERIRGAYLKCVCKTCGQEFRRRPWGTESREYCDLHVLKGLHSIKFTWELADEARYLFEVEHWSMAAIARKYGVNPSAIQKIVNYLRWKPENDPRRKAVKP